MLDESQDQKASYRDTAKPLGGALTSYDRGFVLDYFRDFLVAP